MEKQLDTLKILSDEAKKDEDLDLLIIHHLLPDVIHLLDSVDLNYNIQRVIGIPYSSKEKTLAQVEKRYEAEVTSPEDIDDIGNIVEEFISEYDGEGTLVIMDLGGYCSDIIEDVDANKLKGIIEDTNQGHWSYQDLEQDLPIYSIAQGELKDLENRVVGEAVTFSTERIIRNEFEEEITGEKVLVMGYGGIGKAVSSACDGRNCEVMVFDIDSVNMIEAKLDGYHVGRKEDMIEKADIIIGASGKCSIGQDEVDNLSGRTILSSGSSKQVEFELEYIKEKGERVDKGEDWKEYNMSQANITVLNEGKPVNFLDNSISLSILDLIFSELFACIESLAEEQNPDSGIQEVSKRKKQKIADIWLEFNR